MTSGVIPAERSGSRDRPQNQERFIPMTIPARRLSPPSGMTRIAGSPPPLARPPRQIPAGSDGKLVALLDHRAARHGRGPTLMEDAAAARLRLQTDRHDQFGDAHEMHLSITTFVASDHAIPAPPASRQAHDRTAFATPQPLTPPELSRRHGVCLSQRRRAPARFQGPAARFLRPAAQAPAVG